VYLKVAGDEKTQTAITAGASRAVQGQPHGSHRAIGASAPLYICGYGDPDCDLRHPRRDPTPVDIFPNIGIPVISPKQIREFKDLPVKVVNGTLPMSR
jgi:hypothetical protein